MPNRCVPRPRLNVELLENRVTPSTFSFPANLVMIFQVRMLSTPTAQGAAVGAQNDHSGSNGLALGLLRQLGMTDVKSQTPIVRLDVGLNKDGLVVQVITQGSSLTTDVQVNPGRSKADLSPAKDQDAPVSNNPVRPALAPLFQALAPAAALQSDPVETNPPQQVVSTPQSAPPVQTILIFTAGNNTALQNQQNAAIFLTRNAQQANTASSTNPVPQQGANITAELSSALNPAVARFTDLPLIQRERGVAGERDVVSFPPNSGSNANIQLGEPVRDQVPWLLMDLESSDPAYPILPGLIDELLEWAPQLPLPEWLRGAGPGTPFWAYALLAGGTAGAGWLSAQRRRKQTGKLTDPDEPEEDLTDGFLA